MRVEDFFKDLASSLELTAKEQAQVAHAHNKLRAKLEEKLPLVDHFLTGSYSRKTMIKPKDAKDPYDVDFFLVFSHSDFGEKDLPELLEVVATAIETVTSDDVLVESVKPQKRSIGVIYRGNFQIDAVPAIEIKKAESYRIYDKAKGEAIQSNPELHGDILTKANKKSESSGVQRLKPIIKLLKAWKREKYPDLKSFHLELLAVHLLGAEAIPSFAGGLATFFSRASEHVLSNRLVDPANQENVVDAYLDEDGIRGAVAALLAHESLIAKQALDQENSGDEAEAVETWRQIFSFAKKASDFVVPRVEIKERPPKPWANA